MKAIILAAGRGSRMGKMTDDCPKGLVTLGGVSLLSRQRESLRAGGAEEIAIVTGYKREHVAPYADIEFFNADWETSGILHSLSAAAPLLRKSPCLISYSDIFYTTETVEKLSKNKDDIAISFDPDWLSLWAARFDDPLSDAETFDHDGHGRLLSIGQKTEDLSRIKGQYMGLLKMTPQGWKKIEDKVLSLPSKKTDMTTTLNILISEGEKIGCTEVSGLWGEVDTSRDLELYESWITSGRLDFNQRA